jgi:hypothetical protein
MAKKQNISAFEQIKRALNILDGRRTGSRNQKTIGQNKSALTFVSGSSIETHEKQEFFEKEISNPSTSEILEQLQMGECTLFFYKVTDGSFRRMRCTLQKEQPVPSKYNREGIMVVWDLDAAQWRSFYPNRVFKLIRNEKTNAQ